MNQANDPQQVKVARINSRSAVMTAIITAILAPIILYIFAAAFIHPAPSQSQGSSQVPSQSQGNSQVPSQSQPNIPEVAGPYSGTYLDTKGFQGSMRLSLQQNQQSLTGSCWIKGIEHNIYNGSASADESIRFATVMTTSVGAETVNFIGTRQPDGSLRGEWSGTIGTTNVENGTWNVSRS